MRAVAILACFAFLACGTACSFVSVRSAPSRLPPADQPPRCDTTSSAPTVDVVSAVVITGLTYALVMMGLSMTSHEPDPATTEDHLRGLGYGIVFSSPWILSSTYGFGETARCREVVRAWNELP